MKKVGGRRKRKHNIFNFFIVIIIFGVILWVTIDEFKEKKISDKEDIYITKKINLNYITNTNNEVQSEEVIIENTINELENFVTNNMQKQATNELKNTDVQRTKEEKAENNSENKIISKYKNYSVSAKLEIPKINLETYVLEEFSKESLNVSVNKFWGPNPNEIGNFCIAGHNFKNKNMFSKLKKVEIGDKIFLEDNKNGKLEYKVYEIYVVDPKDVSCLSQNTEGKREVTLITCTNDSKKRIIVKSREV